MNCDEINNADCFVSLIDSSVVVQATPNATWLEGSQALASQSSRALVGECGWIMAAGHREGIHSPSTL